MGSPTDIRGVIQTLWDTKTTEFPTSLLRSPKNMQHRWGVWAKVLNVQLLSGICQK